ncbi:pilus assembly protein CpaF [Paenibacillus sp. PastF-3]|uniref:CpaF family protein n=1 Tax=unclassified Paenibacillus TaxID=185978 RepID=UPI002473B2AE|nr:ATPase, T2SS/T4P/T4SS family [Paenibacillus sp. PastF-3]MDH6372925.1 pilus assembly protein CpaF [Paenibacillus sp. PastF-3]
MSTVDEKALVEGNEQNNLSTVDEKTLVEGNEQNNFYDALQTTEEYMEVMQNPTGSKVTAERAIDAIVNTDAITKVRERLVLEHGNDLARAFFDKEMRNVMEKQIMRIIIDQKLNMDKMSSKEMAKYMCDEIIGLGPIEELMKDNSITEIMINGPKEIYIDKVGLGITLTNLKFDDEDHLLAMAKKMLNMAGATVNEASPIVDARLPDTRINIVIAPVSRNGTTITIRKYPPINMSEEKMIETGLCTKEMFDSLKVLIRGGANILIVGGTGAGKTTIIKRLCEEIPDRERTLTIEDTEELRLKQLYPLKHFISVECRLTDKPETTIDLGKLLKNALRQYPSRIIVGEVRSAEALDMVEILNTGHDGGLSSLHANSAKDGVMRLLQMILRNGLPLDPDIIGQMVATAIDIIVYVEKKVDGTRRITEVIEVLGYKNNQPLVNDLYKFEDIDVEFDENQKIKIIGRHIKGENCVFSKPLIAKLVKKGVSRDELRMWMREDDFSKKGA